MLWVVRDWRIGIDWELRHLSMIVIIGAADAAAEAALMASAPNLKPRFLVFHFRGVDIAFSTFAGTTVTELAEIGGSKTGVFLTIARSLKTCNALIKN